MIDTLQLRKNLGWLGMLLPWIVLILSMVYGFGFPDSISATYYIVTCIAPFMIILGAAGLLLITYKGYDKQDAIVCTLAGVCALLVCLFPCSNTAEDLVGTFYIDKDISGWIHNITAGIFFALLAYNSFFLFTKTSGEMTAEKRKRNLIYKICGIGMIVSFLGLIPTYIFNLHGGTWVVEAIALMFFGISWLTKSQCYTWLFKDKE